MQGNASGFRISSSGALSTNNSLSRTLAREPLPRPAISYGMSQQSVHSSVITIVSLPQILGRPDIITFQTGGVYPWSFSGKQLPSSSNTAPDIPSHTNDNHFHLLADTTGAGFHDLVAFGDTGVSIAHNCGDNTFTTFREVLADFAYNTGWRADKHVRYMVDVRRTGRADILGFGHAGVWLSKNDGGGVFTAPSIVFGDLGYHQGWRPRKHPRLLADFTGDSLPDIVGFGEFRVFLAKNMGEGTFERRLYDLGLDQFTYSSGWRVDKHVRTLADVTGNGRADIVGFGDAGVFVAINNSETGGTIAVQGAQLVLQSFGYDQGWRVKKHPRIVADLTGNGLGDIIGFGERGVCVSKNRGDGTFHNAKLVVCDFGYSQGWRVEKHLRLVVDLTGDGCADIVGFGEEEVYVAYNDGEGGFERVRPFGPRDKGWEVAKREALCRFVLK